MDYSLDSIMENAELKIYQFDIHKRTSLRYFKRKLPYYVMSYHKEGNAKLRIGSQTINIKPGTVILVPPEVEHDHYKESTDETVFLWWDFTYKISGSIDVMKLVQCPVHFQLQNKEEFEKIFLQFVESTTKSHSMSMAILKKAKSLELLYMLLDSALSNRKTIDMKFHSHVFVGLLNYILQNPSEVISLKTISEKLHLHPTYISNRFKELFGKTPMQVHREIRIHHAKQLIESTDMTITEIAEKLGFNGIQTFGRFFTNQVGITPTQYRQIKEHL